ncbi:MAG: polysaccharide biosynthesis protein PslG [Thermoleophilaceae bacterium]|nr:polysaccharide biosynthesis protein PslG [Thermoleophilaceae bacterium]
MTKTMSYPRRMPRSAKRVLALALLSLLTAAAPASARASAPVSASFFGTDADGPLMEGALPQLGSETGVMRRAGVGALRATVYWTTAQPYKTFADVPPDQRASYEDVDGVPTDFKVTDEFAAQTARRGMSFLPVVYGAPRWAAKQPGAFGSPPSDDAAYGRFAAALVKRYGPGGTFWAAHPELPAHPVRDWQIWNEPNLRPFWDDDTWAPGYVKLLRTARRAIRAADPKARVVLAGLPNHSWTALEQLYKAGVHGLFDVAALHPFTGQVDGVLTLVKRARKVMARGHDARTPLMLTEVSWPSAAGKTSYTYGIETSERGQGRKIEAVLPMLARARRSLHIERVYWYTWLSYDRDSVQPFDYAGVASFKDQKIKRKPGYTALVKTVLHLEGKR